MRHDSHISRVDCCWSLAIILVLTGGASLLADNVPNLQRVVLTDRCEEFVLLGSEADTRDVLVMALERSDATDSLLERSRSVKIPQLDRVVLRAGKENGSLARFVSVNDVKAEDNVRVTLVQLDLSTLHVQQLKCLTVRA